MTTSSSSAAGAGRRREHLLVTLPWKEPREQMDRIRQRHPHIDISFLQLGHSKASYWTDHEPLPPGTFEQATILATLHTLPAALADAPRLHLVHLFSAGIDHVVKNPIYGKTDITITTSTGIHGPQIAEWALVTLLSYSHRVPRMLEWQRDRRWEGLPQLGPVRDLVGQRLGVLGYGSIGRQVARVAHAMGMDVIAFTARERPTADSRRDAGYIVPGTGDADGSIPSAWYHGLDQAALHHFLRQDIDVLLVSVPLTAQTTHLLGRAEFDILARAPHHAFISNISRGKVLQQDELIAALKRGAALDPSSVGPGSGSGAEGAASGLRGAALDVTDPEPLPAESELWTLPNVFVTPHISGGGVSYVERAFQVLEMNLDRLERGEPLVNVVKRARGY